MYFRNLSAALALTVSSLLGCTTAYDNSWGTATITLITPGTQYSFVVPQDGTPIYPQFTDSTSWISTSSQLISIQKHCELNTSSGTYALSELGFNYFAVGPPQVITSIACWNPNLRKDWMREGHHVQSGKPARRSNDEDGKVKRDVENSMESMEKRQASGNSGGHGRRWAYITFIGAADASYSIAVSYFGQAAIIPEWQPFNIAISQITSYDINIEKYCSLQTVNSVGPIRDLGPNRWQISPPTQVTGLSCYCDFTRGTCV